MGGVEKVKIDCVFSGGGVKAFAFLGALEAIHEKGLQIERTAGTSAGAIIATLIAAKYTVNEIKNLMEDIQLQQLLDPPKISRFPLFKWILFYYQMGLYKGDRFEKWLYKTFANKGIYTFKDLDENALKIVVSDISLGKLIVIPDDLERVYGIDANTFHIATAVRMSAGFPYFFMPKKLNNSFKSDSYMIDGGILSNFPLWVFREGNKDKRPVLGVTLSEDTTMAKHYTIHNALDMFQALFQTMQQAHDSRYIAKSKQNHIIFIPVKHIKTTDMSISNNQKQSLISMGKEKASEFLDIWP